jgi:hypothetical protein
VKGFVEDRRWLGVLLDKLDGLVVAEESWCSSIDLNLVTRRYC